MARLPIRPPRRQPRHVRDRLRRRERRRTLGRRRRQLRSGQPAVDRRRKWRVCRSGPPRRQPSTSAIAFGDANGDGHLDVVVGNYQAANQLLSAILCTDPGSMRIGRACYLCPSPMSRRVSPSVEACVGAMRSIRSTFWPRRSLYPRLRASPRRAGMLSMRSGDAMASCGRRLRRLLAGYLRARQRQCPVLRVRRRKLQLPLRSCCVHGMLGWNVQLGIACHRVHELPQRWLVSRGRRLLRPRLSSVHGRHVQSQHGRREQRIVPCLSTWQGQSYSWKL